MQVEVAALPSVPFASRGMLPPIPAIYFALSDTGEVLYVGQSTDVRRRWKEHERHGPEMVKIAWLPCTPRRLTALERAIILALRPRLNIQWRRQPPLDLSDGKEKALVTTTQAAELLGVSRVAVSVALKQGRISGTMIGRDWAIEREEVERYLRERKMTGPRRTRPTPPPAAD